MNLYSYVKNNPITDVDVDGHDGDPEVNTGPPTKPDNTSAIRDNGQKPAQAQQQTPQPDAQHKNTITVREVEGQGGNAFGHVTVQVNGGKEVGYGPQQDMTKTEIVENKSVPGQVEPRAPGVGTKDAVTIYVTADQAKAAQGTIDNRTNNPGNYNLLNNNCANFAETVVRSAGGKAPADTTPGGLIRDIRSQQQKDNSVQTPY